VVDDTYLDALPIGHRLHWYVLEGVLGQGGFGITYLARDSNLDRAVAIKEFLPADVALRDGQTVRARTQSHQERYRGGLERFIDEARTLARFDHPHIVRVHSVFEANGTAYMVMRFEEGETLASLLERRGTLAEAELLRIVLPILDGLEAIHRAGFIHRDIKPDNIHIRSDGSPVLLDFGSARQSVGHAKSMTVLVAPGYAPIEQYHGEAKAQGPWTDIYGLGATCYRAIAGEAPRDAIARTKGILGSSREILTPAASAGRGRYSEQLLAAVDHALQLHEADRPQHVGAWRSELVGSTQRPVDEPLPAPPAIVVPPMASTVSTPRFPPARVAGLALVGVAALAGVWLWSSAHRRDAMPVAPPVIVAAPAPTRQATPVVPRSVDAPAETGEATREPVSEQAALKQPVVKLTASTQTTPDLKRPPAIVARTAAPQGEAPRAAAKPPTPDPVASTLASEPATTAGAAGSTLAAAEAAARRGDYASAVRIAKPLGRAGDARAQVLLGAAHENGRGTPRSHFEAYLWYSLAANRDYAGAAVMRERVAAKLQPAELRQADHLIAQWQPHTADTASIHEGSAP
jgi:serine/threonine protein kinase